METQEDFEKAESYNQLCGRVNFLHLNSLNDWMDDFWEKKILTFNKGNVNFVHLNLKDYRLNESYSKVWPMKRIFLHSASLGLSRGVVFNRSQEVYIYAIRTQEVKELQRTLHVRYKYILNIK